MSEKRTDKIPFGEFAYLDRQRIEDFVSSIEGGLARERKVTKHEISAEAKGEVGIPHVMKFGGGVGRKGTELEELKTATDPSLFLRLYAHLETQKLIRNLDSIDEDKLENTQQGELIEFEGNIELSAMDYIVDLFTSWMDFFPVRDAKDRMTFNLMKTMSTQKGFNIKISHKKESRFKFVGYLLSKNLRVTKEELEDEYCVLCRVKRILKPKETFDLFSLPQIRMPKSMVRKLIQSFRSLPPQSRMILRKSIGMEDFRISYPAMIVTPIAIYR